MPQAGALSEDGSTVVDPTKAEERTVTLGFTLSPALMFFSMTVPEMGAVMV